MKATHEIYHSGVKCGTAIELEDGSLSITVDDRFMGIYNNFSLWNPGGDYIIKKIVNFPNESKKIEYEEFVYDLYGMNYGFIPVNIEED